MATFTEQIGDALKPAIPPSDFRVYLFGPGLQPDEVVAPPTSAANNHAAVLDHARYLRYATKLALQKEGFTVDFGETAEILEFWQKSFHVPDSGSKELLHAERGCGAIIMFPASVGAICELGLFAANEPICTKTCIIVHNGYQSEKSFFREGLIEVFDQSKGKVEYRGYENHAECVTTAKRFVSGRYSALLREKGTFDHLKGKHSNTVYAKKF